MAFADPRSCLRSFLQTGRNIGKRPPSLSLRNVQRDARAISTSIENIGTRIEGAIGAVSRGEFLPGQLLSITNELRCPPSAYANFFSQHRQPKFKFMFFAGIELNPDFTEAFGGQWGNGEVWWFIKQSSRPNVTYEYEDVNMYNFRQKILRRATLEPISIQMYDDLQDVSHSFWNTFLRIQNPVTNLNVEAVIEENGMNWTDHSLANDDGSTLSQIRSFNGEEPRFSEVLSNSSSTGILPGGNQFKQIIKSIKIFHLIDWGRKVIVYDFINPRINEIRLDELTWESSEPTVIDVTFEYDTFQIHFPTGIDENEINKWVPSAYPININTDETPFAPVNTAIDRFNTGLQSGIKRVTDIFNPTSNRNISGEGTGGSGSL